MHRTAEIDGDEAIHIVGRVVDEWLHVTPARRVDQHVDPAVAGDHLGGAAPRRFRVGQIDRDSLDRKPGSDGFFGHFRRLGRIDIGTNDARPAAGKFQDRCFADAGGAARDQRRFAVEPHE